MGTGTLALPFAASQGGLLFNLIGLAAFAYWNYYAVDALVKCLHLLPTPVIGVSNNNNSGNADEQHRISGSERCTRHRRTRSSMQRLFHSILHKNEDAVKQYNNDEDEEYYQSVLQNQPPKGTATYGKVAWYALGPIGFQLVDLALLIFFMGVLIAFEDIICSMVANTPFTTNSKALDTLWTIFIIVPIASVPNFKYLSNFSAMGIFAIFFTFIIVTIYGIQQNGSIINGLSQISWSEHMWPKNITAASNWFGVITFGYGVSPITYNIQQSMKEPNLMTKATERALFIVLIVYIIISDGIRILFLPTVPDFDGDVLQYLPNTWLPVTVRLAMIFVILMTAPVLLIPCGELVEGKLGIDSQTQVSHRILVRLCICTICTVTSIYVPGFVYVISFIGSFCISMLGFVFPPLFHLILLKQRLKESSLDMPTGSAKLFMSEQELMKVKDGREGLPSSRDELRKVVIVDVAFLIWGAISTVVTTYLTFASLLEQSSGGGGGGGIDDSVNAR
mmetsp:Transcript_35772/g.54231  ORF Transcript_35772/g.54231 Transcript_35772/m.54231 type:complete len:506 (+) Transcript_35772:543-2060(+)